MVDGIPMKNGLFVKSLFLSCNFEPAQLLILGPLITRSFFLEMIGCNSYDLLCIKWHFFANCERQQWITKLESDLGSFVILLLCILFYEAGICIIVVWIKMQDIFLKKKWFCFVITVLFYSQEKVFFFFCSQIKAKSNSYQWMRNKLKPCLSKAITL